MTVTTVLVAASNRSVGSMLLIDRLFALLRRRHGLDLQTAPPLSLNAVPPAPPDTFVGMPPLAETHCNSPAD